MFQHLYTGLAPLCNFRLPQSGGPDAARLPTILIGCRAQGRIGIFSESNPHSTTKGLTRSFTDISRAWLLHGVVPKMLAAFSSEVMCYTPSMAASLVQLVSHVTSRPAADWADACPRTCLLTQRSLCCSESLSAALTYAELSEGADKIDTSLGLVGAAENSTRQNGELLVRGCGVAILQKWANKVDFGAFIVN